MSPVAGDPRRGAPVVGGPAVGGPVRTRPRPTRRRPREAAAFSGCASWFPVHDAAGQVFGVGLIMLNMASPSAEAAEAAAAEIRRSEERYRSLVLGGAQVVWVASPDGAMKEDSPEWRWITGQSAEDFTGFGWLNSIHPEDRERVERDWRECVRTGKVFDDRYRIRTKGGSYRHYDVRAVPIERDGKIAEWVGASTDVTSQREAEEMRGRLTEQLSAAALRTARLQQATSMLAEALTVEQVVEVITEVGRTAIGALRSAVALLEPDGARLRVVNDDLRNAPDFARGPADAGVPERDDQGDRDPAAGAGRGPRGPAQAVRRRARDRSRARRRGPTSAPGSACRCWRRARRWARCGSRSAGRGRSPRRSGSSSRRWPASARSRSSGPGCTSGSTPRPRRCSAACSPTSCPACPAWSWRPCTVPVTRNMEIGGDWYDAFRLADQRLAVAVGDVMGKGLTAAAGMGRVRNALRALALTDPRPAAVLGGLDRLFSATEQEEQVTTVAYLVIDPETGEGVLGNAGHLPALVLEAGCAPRFVRWRRGPRWAAPARGSSARSA